jgi:hypothetical protein
VAGNESPKLLDIADRVEGWKETDKTGEPSTKMDMVVWEERCEGGRKRGIDTMED